MIKNKEEAEDRLLLSLSFLSSSLGVVDVLLFSLHSSGLDKK